MVSLNEMEESSRSQASNLFLSRRRVQSRMLSDCHFTDSVVAQYL